MLLYLQSSHQTKPGLLVLGPASVYIPTMDCDGAILTKLFLSFMNLTDEINEALS